MDFNIVWLRILAFKGVLFQTVTKLEFFYAVQEDRLLFSRAQTEDGRHVTVNREQMNNAFNQLQQNASPRVQDIRDNIAGPSYVFAILCDPRIGAIRPK